LKAPPPASTSRLAGSKRGLQKKTKKKTLAAASPWLISLFAFAIAVTPEFNFLGIPKVRATDLMLPIILLALSSNLARLPKQRRPPPFPFAPLMIWTLVWDFVCLLVLGEAPMSPGIFYIVKRALFFLIAYMGYCAVSSTQGYLQCLRGFLWSSPLLCLSVLLESRFKRETVETVDAMRASGIIAGQQAQTSLFLVLVLSVCVALWPVFRQKWLLALTMFLGMAAIFSTGTKTALFTGSVALLVLGLGPVRTKLPIPLILVAVAFGWFLVPESVRERLTGVTPEIQLVWTAVTEDPSVMPSTGSSSLANRVVGAQFVFNNLVLASPLVGLGTGYKRLGLIDNFFLAEWVYHGFIGLFLFMMLVWQFATVLRTSIRETSSPEIKASATGVLAGLCAVTVAGLSSESFYLIRPMEALMLLVGLAAGGARVREESD